MVWMVMVEVKLISTQFRGRRGFCNIDKPLNFGVSPERRTLLQLYYPDMVDTSQNLFKFHEMAWILVSVPYMAPKP